MKEICINIDEYNRDSINTIQGNNNAEVYKIYVLFNKRRIDLTGKTVKMAYLRTGTVEGDVINLNVTNATEGEITLQITNAISKRDGVYSCQLAIYGADGFLEHTATFGLTVEANIFTKIAEGIADNKDLTYIENILEQSKTVSSELKTNIPVANNLNSSLENNISNASNINSTLADTTEQSKVAATEAIQKKSELESSIVKAQEFIDGLDGSQDIPGIRMELTELQNGLKSNQALAYTGSSIAAENTLEGRTEDMIVKGKLLHNLFPTKINSLELINTTVNDNIFTTAPSPGTWSNVFDFNNVLYKPATTYTVIVDILENTLIKTQGVEDFKCTMRLGEVSSETVLEESTNFSVLNKTGRINFKITTKSDFSKITNNKGIRLYLDNGFSGGSIKYTIMVLEGDFTNIQINYFDNIKSFGEKEGEIIFASYGKNILDTKGFYSSNNNVTVEEENGTITVKSFNDEAWSNCYKIIYLEPNDYCFHFEGQGDGFVNANIRNADNETISFTGDRKPGEISTFKLEKRTRAILRLYVNGNTQGSFKTTYSNLQLEIGKNKTSYESYVSDIKKIKLTGGLKSLKNTYDELNSINSKFIKRIDKYVFTGNENVTEGGFLSNITRFFIDILVDNVINTRNIVCNNFNYFGTWWDRDVEGMYWDTTVKGRLWFHVKKGRFNSAEEFKNFLKANTTNIYYELAKPVEVDLNQTFNLDTFEHITYVNILNSLQGTLDFKVPSNIGSVVQSNSKAINELYDLINKLIIPGLIDVNRTVAMTTIKNNL
ncbi:BppU family phage baseplate upper protein [Clostridium perfringens]|uniref:BppU family phage baseplate upper protein n=1 Tax=Clostridium perfringens TaxID=1502 RepID=UPI0039EB8BF9